MRIDEEKIKYDISDHCLIEVEFKTKLDNSRRITEADMFAQRK